MISLSTLVMLALMNKAGLCKTALRVFVKLCEIAANKTVGTKLSVYEKIILVNEETLAPTSIRMDSSSAFSGSV